jgi:hypothetical protein
MSNIFGLSCNGCVNTNSTKFSKCAFWLTEVPFLGHVISAEGITIDPSKVQEVLGWKAPRPVMQICNFLGFFQDL